MRQATTIHPAQRQKFGLLQLADNADLNRSVETDGTVTDHGKVLASKVMNKPYSQVSQSEAMAVMQMNSRFGWGR